MRVAIVGMGRMGQAVEEVLMARGHAVVARVDVEGDEEGRTLAEAVQVHRPDVAIEFTTPSSVRQNLDTLIHLGVPAVSGTTGWDVEDIRVAVEAGSTAVLYSANFSIGVAVMKRAVAVAAQMLRRFEDFEPGVFERHHSAKVDAPSGTARVLAQTVQRNGGGGEVPAVALRQGGQPGEHTVYFDGPLESLAINHRARSRSVFADGAVRAAEWLVETRPVGVVSFDDFLERTSS